MKTNPNENEILISFINSLISRLAVKSVLVLQHSEFKSFESISCEKKEASSFSDGVPKTGKWDLILADLPIGMKAELNGKMTSYILKTIANAAGLISDNGLLLTFGEPLLLRNNSNGVRAIVEKENCALSAIINSPDGLWKPFTMLRLPLFVIKKSVVSGEFIGELLDIEQAEKLAYSLVSNVSGTSLEQGIIVEAGKFDGFPAWKVRLQIQALESEYKEFNTRRLGGLLKSINSVRPHSDFAKQPNCLYIHKVGTKPVLSNLEDLTSRHSNFYQCVCDAELVDASYLESFFGSRLGRLILNSMSSGSYIPRITLESLTGVEVSIPPLQAQKQIVNSISKMRKIREVIRQFEDDLALNPIGSDQTLRQIDSMLDVVGGLADADKVMSLIRDGESKLTEFKETLTLDVKKQTKEKYIELSAIKTIAAFMNSASGTLLVGVDDLGEIHGVDYEISKFYGTHDDFLLKFRNLLKERIGGQAYDFVDYRLVKIGEKHVLIVECRESPVPIYVDENDFYVRTNPATDRLDGPKMVQYITSHFVTK